MAREETGDRVKRSEAYTETIAEVQAANQQCLDALAARTDGHDMTEGLELGAEEMERVKGIEPSS